MTPTLATRLDKAATDAGFDLSAAAPEGWLGFASTLAPLRVWLAPMGSGFLAAFSMEHVARALAEHGALVHQPLPPDAVAALLVGDLNTLHRLLNRSLPLARTLPNALLDQFVVGTQKLPRSTEAERLVVQRVGQDVFRKGLLEFWQNRCAITGLAVPGLLRASHIKPWADCGDDAERLDVFNGLLLAPHPDAVFDQGFITVNATGAVVVAPTLADSARAILGLDQPLRVHGLQAGHNKYLAYHRGRVFHG